LVKEYGKDLNWLFELRGAGDYGVTIHVSQVDAEKAIRTAEEFLSAVQTMLTQQGGTPEPGSV